MKGGISVLVGALLVVFSLTMVAEAQRKNRIRGNQGRRSVGKSSTTIQRNRKGKSSFRDIVDGSSNTQLRDNRTIKRGFQQGTVSDRDISDGSTNTLRREGARKNRGAGTAMQSTSKGFIRSTPGAGGVERNRFKAGATSYPIQRKRTEMMSGSHAGDYDMIQRKRKGQPSLILDDTTSPSLRDNRGVERKRR